MSKCRYCDFVSFSDKGDLAKSYITCVLGEAKKRAEQLKSYTFSSIYIGGGTPSVVDEKYMAMLILGLKKYFVVTQDAEITIEMNPGTVTADKIKLYKSAGVNRFSVGLQSANDALLEDIGRIHTYKDFEDCARLLKGENFSADIMIGLKGQTIDDIVDSIQKAAAQGASHISMYALTPEEGTPIYTDYLNGDLPDGDSVRDMYDSGYAALKSLGFKRYEVSNFARPGFESRHNKNYWKRGEYIGLGVAASSHINDVRFNNTLDLDEYFKCILSGNFAQISSEKIEGQDKKDEYIMLALRTSDGVDIGDWFSVFGTDFFVENKDGLDVCAAYLDITPSRVSIKDEYLFVQNSIIVEFLGI